ncbi:MAG TPA: tRNA (N6-threonylcarbamoyladenosine(37)-N6)-methyltransferase TrmO [Polyangiales bacterium]|jgi:tRNA-Thr(GGU) m(6)t(6)A37 methyltransferase TsaA|nr:tRNA (N6-threonylcarbamoyladenosine(37)-N6)-methyltransferase TrmO [Polyangiales bacterium]
MSLKFPAPLALTPIGVVHSPWKDKHGTPRQPAFARGVAGQIEIIAGAEYEHALEDIETWSHIWVLFWFHKNTGWNPKVLPPRSQKKRGVFATRSPHRPNPIGLSVVRLERIEGRVLHVLDLDILDQTPVLDLKPYVAYTDSIPAAGGGWLETADAPPDPGPQYGVTYAPLAEQQLAWLEGKAAFDLRAMAEDVLRAGPTPHPYRRIRAHEGHYSLGAKDFRVLFTVDLDTNQVTVLEVASGYRKRVLEDPRAEPTELTPLEVHRAFVLEFSRR